MKNLLPRFIERWMTFTSVFRKHDYSLIKPKGMIPDMAKVICRKCDYPWWFQVLDNDLNTRSFNHSEQNVHGCKGYKKQQEK